MLQNAVLNVHCQMSSLGITVNSFQMFETGLEFP